MLWAKEDSVWIPQYKQTSSTKDGFRYKLDGNKSIPVAEISIETCKLTTEDLKQLILLGHHVCYPVAYNFVEPQRTVSIELVSANLLREALR